MYRPNDEDGFETALAAQDAGGIDAPAAALSNAQIDRDFCQSERHGDDTGQASTARLRRQYGVRDRFEAWRLGVSSRADTMDIAPDLARDIGSARWFRGFGTMLALGAAAFAFWPDFAPLRAAPPINIDAPSRDEYRSQMIMPLALGADSGRHMGATAAVTPLQSAPERPRVELLATLARGDSFARMLQRSGVGSTEANRVETMISRALPASEIADGTRIDIVLGRRPAAGEARPLERLSFRARFDLELGIVRNGGNLSLERTAIRVDDTPLRIRGTVGDSLYRSARAAGAPASAVQQYLQTLTAQSEQAEDLRPTDTFDMVLSHRRAATGERQAGQLLYAGLERGGDPVAQLMRWGDDGKFYEASGVGEQRSGMVAPVPGRISSSFGMRRHPILGYRRMHSGMDFKARHGTPIVAVSDGTVTGAGRMGGCGNAVRVNHGGGLQTRYCHMSRLAVSGGQAVRRGQVIGYVGSTGLSTGPHLHYEMYRGGRAIDPASVSFVTRAQLSGSDLRRFRESLARLKTVTPGAALQPLVSAAPVDTAPKREIERLEGPRPIG